MTKRPITFSTPIINAILAGRKTQTRLLVSPHTCTVNGYRVRQADAEWQALDFTRAVVRQQSTLTLAAVGPDEAPPDPHLDVPLKPPDQDMRYRVRAIIESDTRLWVREEHCFIHGLVDGGAKTISTMYRADGEESGCGWQPAKCMPRWASRITLIVTDVRLQRLQEISEEDAEREGVGERWTTTVEGWRRDTPREAFAALWNELHGRGSWDANAWVIALTFETETLR